MKARGPVLGLALACLVAATAVADTFSFSGDRTEVVLAEGHGPAPREDRRAVLI